MCFFKAPNITVPDTPTPAPLPPPIEESPKVESVDFGGGVESDTETASGVKGQKATGKSSLKIEKEKKPVTSKVGANLTI